MTIKESGKHNQCTTITYQLFRRIKKKTFF